MKGHSRFTQSGQASDQASVVISSAVVLDEPEPAVVLLVQGIYRCARNLDGSHTYPCRAGAVLGQLVAFQSPIRGRNRIEQFVFKHRPIASIGELAIQKIIAIHFILNKDSRTGVRIARRDHPDEVVLSAEDAPGPVHGAFYHDLFLTKLIPCPAAVDRDLIMQTTEEVV